MCNVCEAIYKQLTYNPCHNEVSQVKRVFTNHMTRPLSKTSSHKGKGRHAQKEPVATNFNFYHDNIKDNYV